MDTDSKEFQKLFQRIQNTEGFKPTIHQDATIEDFEQNYLLSSKLGIGGFSIVKRCQKISTGEEFAVKIVDKKKYRKRHNRLIQEIEVLSKVNHKNCIRLYEAYITKTTVLLVTDLVRGGELLDRIMQFGYFQESYACYILKMVLEGVDYLHCNGIVHRDLKLENILFLDTTPLAQIAIADFGLSKVVKEDSILSTICGSPQYVAPEILESGAAVRSYTPQVDIWSLGVLLYIMLCGSPPFDTQYGDSAMFDKIKNGKYLTQGPIWDKVSYQAKDFMAKLLTIDSKKRATANQALEHSWIQNMSDKSKIDVSQLQIRPRVNLNSWQGNYDSKAGHQEWTFAKLKQKSSINLSLNNDGSHKNMSFHDKSLISNGSTYAQSHVTSRRSFYFDDQLKGLGNSEVRYSLSNILKKKFSQSSFMSGETEASRHSSELESTVLSQIDNYESQRNISNNELLQNPHGNHVKKPIRAKRSSRKRSTISQRSFQNDHKTHDLQTTNSNNSNSYNNGNYSNTALQKGAISSQKISDLINSDNMEVKKQDATYVQEIHDHRLSQFLQNLEQVPDQVYNRQKSRDNKSQATISQDSLQNHKSFEYDFVDFSNKSSNNQQIQSRSNSLREPGHQLNQENLGNLQLQDLEAAQLQGVLNISPKFKNFMEPSFTLLQPQISLRDIVTSQTETKNVKREQLQSDPTTQKFKNDLPVNGDVSTFELIQQQLMPNDALNVSLDDIETSSVGMRNESQGQEYSGQENMEVQSPGKTSYNQPTEGNQDNEDKEWIQSTSFSFFPGS